MKKFILTLVILFVFVCFSKLANAAEPISVGKVTVNKVSVYSSPDSSSKVIGFLLQDEEHPILNQKLASGNVVTHNVKTGDTLYLIARHYGISVENLKRVNGIIGTRLFVGQSLTIPQDMVHHSVDRRDSLWKIARAYNVTIDSLIKYNGIHAIILEKGSSLKVPGGYYQLQLLGGKTGWIQRSAVDASKQDRFNLGWMYNGTPEVYQQQLRFSGLEVVSPRWYTLSQTELLNMNEDKNYAVDAAKAGKQVWPLFGNLFDPALTDYILSDSNRRQKVIEMLKRSLERSKAQGINVDFENIDPKNKQHYVLFIQELKRVLTPLGLVVSVDVSRENGDPFWSGSLDRSGLGKAADYIIMMGYDEHWASSPKAGSVASLPWTREGIKLLMNEVPAHKIILGVPFYTREWITDQSGKVRSLDRTILETEKLIRDKGLTKKWDPATSQNYVEFDEKGEKHQIWIEDETSLKLRYDLVKEYQLRGTAAWYVGGGSESIWEYLN